MIQAQTSTSHVNDVIYQVVNKIAEVEDVDPLELTENQEKASRFSAERMSILRSST